MGIHYEKTKRNFPIAMTYGQPNTAKTTALECALSVIGRSDLPMGDEL